jgi:hypothetical protein
MSTPLTSLTSQTDIVYENDQLQFLVEKGTLQRQKRFNLQDHLFYMKIRLKHDNEPIPLLKNILFFLEQGLLHVMNNLKKFYDKKDANICFLTLHQEPMLIGLNSGEAYIPFIAFSSIFHSHIILNTVKM